MEIRDFEYIKIPPPASLEERITETYFLNNRPKTLKHVQEVADTCVKIADQYGLDREKCRIAGLLHDIGAVMKSEHMVDYTVSHGIQLDEAEKMYPFLLHQRVSRMFAEDVLGIKDEDILSAVECHTTLKSCPGKYDMALFIADKLSWDREGVPPYFNEVKRGLQLSLESASLAYITYSMDNGMILHPHRWLLEAKEYLERIN
ncbi:MAG: bis(5'-nucleosyl)-tetraphosphatase (symmetrical) YqeK [Acetatifactor sp.]|nr:bis(5'-nucleosyl)-tetraphosphatase (symmetrical) YqeK [Acetatifactor sp.]